MEEPRRMGDAPEPTILYEDRQVVVVNKPSGWLSQPDETGDPCIAQWLVEVLRERRRQERASSPAMRSEEGEAAHQYTPFVAPVHRLDRPVSGALALARTSKAAARLTAQFATRDIEKVYLAVVERKGAVLPTEQTVTLHLCKDRSANRVQWRWAASGSKAPDGWDIAVTEIRILCQASEHCLLEMRPHTGRPHQLRVTMAHLGHPIVGDLKYGSMVALGPKLALHARSVAFHHPTQGNLIQVSCPLPHWWCEVFPDLPL